MNRWGAAAGWASMARRRFPTRCVSSVAPGPSPPSSNDDPEFTESSQGKEALTHLVRKTIRMGSDVHRLNQSVRLMDDANSAMRVHLAKLAPRVDALENQNAEILSRQQSLAAHLSQIELKLSQLESRKESPAAKDVDPASRAHGNVSAVPDVGRSAGRVPLVVAQADVCQGSTTQSGLPPVETERLRNEYQWLRNRVESLAATVALVQHERAVEKVGPIPPRNAVLLRREDRAVGGHAARGGVGESSSHCRSHRALPMSAVEDISGDVVVRAAKVLVRHVPPSIPATSIRTLCASVGPVKSVMVVQNAEKSETNHRTMVVTFDSVATANEAVCKLNGMQLGTQQRLTVADGQRRSPDARSGSAAASGPEERGIVVEPYAVHDVAAEATSALLVETVKEQRGAVSGTPESAALTASPLAHTQKLTLTQNPGDERPGGGSRDSIPTQQRGRDDGSGEFRLEDMLDAFDHHHGSF